MTKNNQAKLKAKFHSVKGSQPLSQAQTHRQPSLKNKKNSSTLNLNQGTAKKWIKATNIIDERQAAKYIFFKMETVHRSCGN